MRRRSVHNCDDLLRHGHNVSGVYEVYLAEARQFVKVYCDMETDGGGWLVRTCVHYVSTKREEANFAIFEAVENVVEAVRQQPQQRSQVILIVISFCNLLMLLAVAFPIFPVWCRWVMISAVSWYSLVLLSEIVNTFHDETVIVVN